MADLNLKDHRTAYKDRSAGLNDEGKSLTLGWTRVTSGVNSGWKSCKWNKFAVAFFTIVAEFIEFDTVKSIETDCIRFSSRRSGRGSVLNA